MKQLPTTEGRRGSSLRRWLALLAFAVASWSALAAAAPQELLLSRSRVRATLDWRSPYSGETGTAFSLPQNDAFGFFYFSDPNNPEVFVKVLDFGADRPYLVFHGGLTSFEYTATFTVVATGQSLSFHKLALDYSGGADGVTLLHGPGGAAGDGTETGETSAQAAAGSPPPGMSVWLKPEPLLSLSRSLSRWPDASGLGRDAIQSDPSLQPSVRAGALNGLPGVSFDGVKQQMTIPGFLAAGTGPYSVFAVVRADVLGQRGFLGAGTPGVNFASNGFRFSSSGEVANYWWGDDLLTAPGSVAAGSPYILSFLFDPASGRQIWVNGIRAAGSPSASRNTNASTYLLGRTPSSAGEFWQGDVVEVLSYDKALDPAQKVSAEQYLFSKFLPSAPLHLLGGSVTVQVSWRSQYSGQTGTALALPQQDGFGYFSFGDPANPEVFVKVLDFGADRPYLLFFGGLTDFEYTVTFTNIQTGRSASFHKEAGSYAGGADTTSLPH